MKTFTREQVFHALAARYRSYNHGSKQELIEGLTPEQIEALGNLSLAMKDLEKSEAVEVLGDINLWRI